METLLKPGLGAFEAPQIAPLEHLQTERKQISGRSWIIGVTLVYSAFAVATLTIVGFTFTQKVDLVSDKYYQQEVAFQSRIDAANRAQALAEPVRWRVAESAKGAVLEITYPQSMISRGLSGTITLFRASTLGADKTFSVKPDAEGKQYIPLQGLMQGLWTVSLDWRFGDKAYYKASDVKL